MNVGLSTLYDIGSNYTIKLNEKELLVFEKDETRESQNVEEKKPQELSKDSSPKELCEDEERLLKDLQARDSEVKAHEAAHQAVGGGMTGAASYTYQQGPDGKMYAIGGEVSISMKAGSSPEETIANARQLAAAAMATGNPSPQDHAVASSARVMEMKARQQLAKQEQEEVSGRDIYSDVQTPAKQDDTNLKVPLDILA